MPGQMDKSLFFITLSAVCVWLIVDMAVGKDRLGNFLATLFPFMDSAGTEPVNSDTTPNSNESGSNESDSKPRVNPYGVRGGRPIE